MYRLHSSLKIEIKIFNRIKWMQIPFVLFLIYFAWKANDFIATGFPGDSVNMTPYLTQALLFLFSIYGVLLAQQERDDDSYEVFCSIPRSIGIKTIAKFMHLACLSALFGLMSVSILFSLFYIYRIPAEFYLSTLNYLVLYGLIPSLFGSLIGLILGLVMHAKAAFPVILLIGLLIGPLNQTLIVSSVQYLPESLRKLTFFINVGQSDPMFYYNIVYGLPTESFRFISKSYSLLILFIVLLVVIYRKQKEKGFAVVTLVACALVAAFGAQAWKVFSPHLSELTVHQSISSDNVDYQGQPLIYQARNSDFKITDYEMQLSIDENLHNKVKFHLKPNQPIETPVFTLYHGFKVHSVRYQEQELTFKQQRDYVQVNLFKQALKGEEIELELIYDGKGPQRFFAHTHAVMLPGFFPWYPIPGTGPAAAFEDYYMTLFRYYKPTLPVKFQFEYSGSIPLHTNLTKETANSWSGSSTLGLTLVSGAMEEIKAEETRVVRPYALYRMEDPLAVKKRLNELYEEIGTDLGIETEPLADFFILDTELNDGGFWAGDDHFIISAGILSNHVHSFDTEPFLVSQIVESLLRRGSWYKQDHEMRRMIVQSYAYAYTRLHLPEDLHPDPPAPLVGEEGRLNKQEVVQQSIAFIDDSIASPKDLNRFFRRWAAKMQAEKVMTWEELSRLLSTDVDQNENL